MITWLLVGANLFLAGAIFGFVLFWRVSLYAFKRHGLVVVNQSDLPASSKPLA